jgi:hypothetical protein
VSGTGIAQPLAPGRNALAGLGGDQPHFDGGTDVAGIRDTVIDLPAGGSVLHGWEFASPLRFSQ